MPSATFSVSSQSRTTLRTFFFEAQPFDDARESDKENINDANFVPGLADGSQKLRQGDDDMQKSSQQLPQLPLEKQCPHTPANRIPLADLIGNTEDAFNCDPKDTTPEDHIYWQHGPTPRSSIPSATANNARRGKKRARSSSPASSSQNQKSAHFDTEETLDLKILQESLKTPHNDPALDLWARYTDASLVKKDADGKPLPAFAHLMTSSPQTPNTTDSKASGLQRSISCGNEWPASKSKRRKFNHESAEGKVKDIFAASKAAIMASGKSKASRITLLMEKLQENSRKVPQIEVSGPSSSSPLPDRFGPLNTHALSPAPKRIAAQQEQHDQAQTEETLEPSHDVRAPWQEDEGRESLSSDFGDEDLALDILEAVEQSTCIQAAIQTAEKQPCANPATINDVKHQTHHELVSQNCDDQSSSRPVAVTLLPGSEHQVEEMLKHPLKCRTRSMAMLTMMTSLEMKVMTTV